MIFTMVNRGVVAAMALCALTTIARAQSARPAAPTSTGELAAAFRRAHEHKDVKAILDFVYWGNSIDANRAGMSGQITDDFPLSIERITFDSLAKGETLSHTKNGVTYRPTLPALGRLVVHFAREAGSSATDRITSYLYGSTNGRFFLLTTERTTP